MPEQDIVIVPKPAELKLTTHPATVTVSPPSAPRQDKSKRIRTSAVSRPSSNVIVRLPEPSTAAGSTVLESGLYWLE